MHAERPELDAIGIASHDLYEVAVPHEGFRRLRAGDPVHWHPLDARARRSALTAR